MCGYIRRELTQMALQSFLTPLGWGDLANKSFRTGQWHFYPAFGARPERRIQGVLCASPDEATESLSATSCALPEVVDATWWFDCHAEGDTLRVGRRTTFNARNLESPFWRSALYGHRALVLATAIGETQTQGGRKVHYLMEAEQPFFLGALYRRFDNGLYSCAVITKSPSPGFAQFHEKAAPLILPADSALLRQWLDPQVRVSQVPELALWLTAPALPIDLKVTPVKTFKRGEAIGETQLLAAEGV